VSDAQIDGNVVSSGDTCGLLHTKCTNSLFKNVTIAVLNTEKYKNPVHTDMTTTYQGSTYDANTLESGTIYQAALMAEDTGTIAKQSIYANITINYTQVPYKDQGAAFIATASVHADNIIVNAQAYNGYAGPDIILQGKDSIIEHLKTSGEMGTLYVDSLGSLIEIDTFRSEKLRLGTSNTLEDLFTPGITCPIVNLKPSTLLLKDFKLNKGINCKAISQQSSYSKYLLNSVNYKGNDILHAVANAKAEVYSANHNRAKGVWRSESRNGFLASTDLVKRQGGKSYSIYAIMSETAKGRNKYALSLSKKGRESIYLSLDLGYNVVRLYGCSTGALPTTRDVGLTFDYFDGLYGFHSINTLKPPYATVQQDTSTWDGLQSYTPFVVEVVIPSAIAQACPTNIYLSPEYDALGVIYIDPLPTIGAS
jgi:hypothetical protein